MIIKPPRGTLINLSNPLTIGLDLAMVSDWDYDPIYQRPVTRTGSTTAGGLRGDGLKTTGAGQYALGYWPKRSYTAKTQLMVFDSGTIPAYGRIFSDGNNTNLDTFARGITGSTYFSWVVHGPNWNTTSTLINNLNWGESFDNSSNVIVLNWDSFADAKGRGYRNGKLCITSSSPVNTASNRTASDAVASCRFGAVHSSYSLGSDARFYTIMHWARGLSVAEIEEISANPWVIFNTKRVFYMYNPPVASKAYSQIINGWW